MPAQTSFFVQFPHPGPEHNPAVDEMPWNSPPHRRKFLIAPGSYSDGGPGVTDAELVFWGEWEPPSVVEWRWPPSDHLPRALHRPFWGKPDSNGFRQNTDPWVFGDRMIYSNCKQAVGQMHRPTSMQKLSRGSVICFGSTIGNEFCLDTVLVVASRQSWTAARVEELAVDDAFKVCVGGATCTTKDFERVSFTLYRGATFDDPVDGMFSFVPARRADSQELRFARPAIRSTLISPTSRQSTWGSKRRMPIDDVRRAWDAVRSQVLAVGLLLAVKLATPEQREAASVRSTTRECC